MKSYLKTVLHACGCAAVVVFIGIIITEVLAQPSSSIRLRDLQDVRIATTPATGHVLTWNGSRWTNNPTSAAAGTIDGLGVASTLSIWSDTNTLASIPNGVGILTNDGAGGFGFSTNIAQDVTINNQTVTNQTVIQQSVTTQNFHIGKGGNLTITNSLEFNWGVLTMSGSNVSAINMTNASMWRLDLTNNGFLVAPINVPGTNFGKTFQLHVKQDSTGGRSLYATNAAWVISGSGTSTNALLSITTNANAVSVLTFATSPFDSAKVYGVTTPF